MSFDYEGSVNTAQTLVTTAETVVATITGVTSKLAGQRFHFEGHINYAAGVGTTTQSIRIRQDSLTGTVVDTIETDVLVAAVGQPEDHFLDADFAPVGELSGKTFVLTVQQNSATGNGTVNYAALRCDRQG